MTEEEKEENIILIGNYGDDKTIVNSARMSYNSEKTHTEEEDNELIKKMLESGHTSPFEQVNFTFKLKMPIFIARQWMRHRTAKINEQSGRYTQLNNEFYKLNKKNLRFVKDVNVDETKKENIEYVIETFYESVYDFYKNLLKEGVVKEQARTILPLATYTTFIWQMDLHNLMHFLELRLSKGAQFEIREYAKEILRLIEPICPITIKYFKELRLSNA